MGRLIYAFIVRVFRLGYNFYFFLTGRRRTTFVSGKIVSRKYKFILFLVPRVATRSFLISFVARPSLNFEAFQTREDLGELFPGGHGQSDYYKFAIVRNPWDRVISCYNDKIRNADSINKVNIITKYRGLRPGMSFDEFVRWLCSSEGQDENADGHWISQYKPLTDDKGNIICDYIGRLENLETDFKHICKEIPMPYFDVPHRNRSRGRDINYRKYYNDETRYLVARRYRKDIELFGYDF